jgi:hypothetical protein
MTKKGLGKEERGEGTRSPNREGGGGLICDGGVHPQRGGWDWVRVGFRLLLRVTRIEVSLFAQPSIKLCYLIR